MTDRTAQGIARPKRNRRRKSTAGKLLSSVAKSASRKSKAIKRSAKKNFRAAKRASTRLVKKQQRAASRLVRQQRRAATRLAKNAGRRSSAVLRRAQRKSAALGKVARRRTARLAKTGAKRAKQTKKLLRRASKRTTKALKAVRKGYRDKQRARLRKQREAAAETRRRQRAERLAKTRVELSGDVDVTAAVIVQASADRGASRPGEPPKMRTGKGRDSIKAELRRSQPGRGKLTARTYVDKKIAHYMALWEFRPDKEQRPFLKPGVEKNANLIGNAMAADLKRFATAQPKQRAVVR